MCGINGIFGYAADAPPVSNPELLKVCDTMVLRGPDGAGAWLSQDARVGLANRRLAILDLSEAGAQPMCSADGSVVITFNGEIYNYRELRADLEAKGVRFRSTSDTEVLLQLYRDRGSDMVDLLRGMFALAIWDERRQALFLARDPFGIKPLYYADDGRTFRFASQVKALLAGEGIDRRTSAAGLAGFYLWGSVPEPFTLYQGIRQLFAGTTLWVDRDHGVTTTRRYFRISHELRGAEEAPAIPREEKRERLAAALRDSVKHHLIADVPVGLFLSSGLDSTTIATLARDMGTSAMHSLTLGFREFEGSDEDEAPLARATAQRLGTTHTTSVISKADMDEEVEHIRRAMDQPSIDGVNTFFVSREAARAGMKVALAGTGGDELFGGYPSFSEIPRAAKMLGHVPMSRPLGKLFRLVTAPWLEHFTSPKYAGLFEYGGSYGGLYLLRRGLFMPWELPRLMDPQLAKEGWEELAAIARLDRKVARIDSPYAKVAAMELRQYLRNQLLRDTDWAGMAWSLEIRVPFVDRDLLRTVASWLRSAEPPTKLDMAAAGAPRIPRELLARKKSGFGIPVSTWANVPAERGLRGWARSLIGHARLDGASLSLGRGPG
jgi:asparagine synthase (glutamine-hydrolysing)